MITGHIRVLRTVVVTAVLSGTLAQLSVSLPTQDETEDVTTSLVEAAAELRRAYTLEQDAARAEMLTAIDEVIAATRGKFKSKSAEAQQEAVAPLLADRARVAASVSSIPSSPELAKIAASYEKKAAEGRAKHRKAVTSVVDKLRRAKLHDSAESIVQQLDGYCPQTINCKVFTGTMEEIVLKFKREVIERQIAIPAVEIRDLLIALYDEAQRNAISAVDLTARTEQLRLTVVESEPYRIGNTPGAKDGQVKAYPYLRELESYLAATLKQAK